MQRSERRRRAFLAKQRVKNWYWFKRGFNGQPMVWDNPNRIIGISARTPKNSTGLAAVRMRDLEGPTIQELRAADIDDWDDWYE